MMCPINFLDPYMFITIDKPKTKNEMKTMLLALKMYAEEDSSFFVYINDISKKTIIAGKGEQHLNSIVSFIRNEFNIEIYTNAPQTLYKETLRQKVISEGRFIRQSGCPFRYGHCWIEIEPKPRDTGYDFINKVTDENIIPREYISSIDEGIQRAMTKGILANYPVVDIKATLFNGSYHQSDSSQMTFGLAGMMAFKRGMEQADPVILEPIMKLNIEVTNCNIPVLINKIHSMRGKNEEIKSINHILMLTAEVPLSELSDYTKAGNETQRFSINFGYYDEVPENIKEALILESSFRDARYIDLFFWSKWGQSDEEHYLMDFIQSFWN